MFLDQVVKFISILIAIFGAILTLFSFILGAVIMVDTALDRYFWKACGRIGRGVRAIWKRKEIAQ